MTPECCGKRMWKNGDVEPNVPRWICGKCGRKTRRAQGPDDSPGYNEAAAESRSREIERAAQAGEITRFVITAAQNNTRTHKGFLRSLERYCQHNRSTLLVQPIHYKNISLFSGGQQYRKYWARSVQPYLVNQRINLGGNVIVRANINVAATAAQPLSGFQPIEGQSWVIIGHPQVAMEPVASPGGMKPKRVYTTGAVTVRNYSETKAGAKADFHHVHGALAVEIVGDHAFIRELNADSRGRFYDLDGFYTPTGATFGHRVAALVTGDEHVKFHSPQVRAATYDAPDSMAATLKPEKIIRHDILDGYAGSHHHENDDVTLFRKYWKGDHDYRQELDQVVDFINETTPAGAENWIVPSNHDEHLQKWLSRVDPRRDHCNALLIHELKALQYQDALAGGDSSALRLYLQPRLTCKTVFLDRSRPALIGGVDMSQHGDMGVNGSRGSARSLANTTYKMFIGHSHSARIVMGVHQVGKSTGALEYERGLGAHTNTHGIQYRNGKRTLVDIFDGQWRAAR